LAIKAPAHQEKSYAPAAAGNTGITHQAKPGISGEI
jgi:hypothetical protein